MKISTERINGAGRNHYLAESAPVLYPDYEEGIKNGRGSRMKYCLSVNIVRVNLGISSF